MRFTTRPEITGTFGVAASTHWIATAVGMAMLEKGGNAFDAAVAMGFTLQVCEPHLNGPGGDMPAVVMAAGEAPKILCGQAPAPAGATIEAYRAEGLTDVIPGAGLLATVIPGAFDGWMLMLRDHGTVTPAEALAPAIHYAATGVPTLPRVADTIAGLAEFFETHWPTSAEVWLPAPVAGRLHRNPILAETWRRLVREGEAAGADREAQIEAVRRAWAEGFVAEAVDAFVRAGPVSDGGGTPRRGVITGQDMAGWRATWEPTVSRPHAGWQVHKTGPWGQGPVLLQSLGLLEGIVEDLDPEGPAFVHTVTEAMKLAYADREAFYGDPLHADIPLDALLDPAHAAARRALIGEGASTEQRPSRLPGLEGWADAAVARAARTVSAEAGATGGEPTMAHLTRRRGDTVHLDVIDRWGNAVAATPSGGWLQASPAIPGLGFCLNSRAQMFWLEEGLPTSLAPGRRPRTTLSPSLAIGPEGQVLVFGTPGGDQQDQWQLAFFLRVAHHGLNLQEAIDGPLFHTAHFTGSFAPRNARPGHLLAEESFGEAALADLRRRGHALEVAPAWTAGRLTAAQRDADGLLRAAATPRLMQAYAAGR